MKTASQRNTNEAGPVIRQDTLPQGSMHLTTSGSVGLRVSFLLCFAILTGNAAEKPGEDRFTPGDRYGTELLEPALPKPVFTTSPQMTAHPWRGVAEMSATLTRRTMEFPAGCRLVSHGCRVTASSKPLSGELALITDGNRAAEAGSAVVLPEGKQWVQIDLGTDLDLHGIWMWQDHGMPAVFRGVKVELANDENGPWITVYNTDPDPCCSSPELLHYQTASGISFPVYRDNTARYVRLWSAGADKFTENKWTEVSVYGRKPDQAPYDYFRPLGAGKVRLEAELPRPKSTASPTAPPELVGQNVDFEYWKYHQNVVIAEGCRLLSLKCPVTVSDPEPLGEPSRVTDGQRSSDDDTMVDLAMGKQWVLIDLGARREVHCIWLWLNHRIPWWSYRDVVVQVTDAPDKPADASTVTVLNTDTDGSSGMGKGTDKGWVEFFNGRPITFPPVKGRYIKVWTNGNNHDDTNQFTEVAVYGKEIAGESKPAGAKSAKSQPDDLELVQKIHALIVQKSKVTTAEMKPYTAKVPRAGNAAFAMVPIPGGEFLMGSPDKEKDRKPDEGPQVKVKIDPFWMGAHEVTWDTAMAFVMDITGNQYRERKPGPRSLTEDFIDATTGPSEVHYNLTHGMGLEGHPVISVTQHFALKYCQWLSAQTGHFYRLPTEAEWEYAARAGTTTAYFWGDDPAAIGDYAWFFDNSDGKTAKVGQKKPNPWGLYDICGNVAEWTLDQYDRGWYATLTTEESRTNPFHSPTTLYPRTVRGGSYDDDPHQCRSATRRGSSAQWQVQDPMEPKSLWHLSNAHFLGFRIVRPLKVPSPQEMHRIWNLGTVGVGR